MKSNLTPQALDEMTIEDIAQLDIADLHRLHDEVEAGAKEWRERMTRVVDALECRFGVRAVTLLANEGKNSGTIHFPERGTDVKRTTSQKIEWDQSVLTDIRTRVIGAKENPDRYMVAEYIVSEAIYKTFSEREKAEFDKGRTIKPQRARYAFTKI